jgi:DNA-binding NarL/FixJ family response regulator
VDDEPVAPVRLATLIALEDYLTICGEATNTSEGIALVRKLNPNLAILDIAVEGDRGLDFIQAAQKECVVLVFSASSAAAPESESCAATHPSDRGRAFGGN